MMTGSSINIASHKPHPLLEKYIRKISVFKSKGIINYTQKLTPTAFMYFTYHHEDIPPNIIGNKKKYPDFRLQIDGPKINQDTFIEYNGKLNRIMIEFSASGFYYLFHKSPTKCVDQLCRLENFFDNGEVLTLENELQALDNSESQIKIIQEFLLELFYKALPSSDYVENSLKIIDDNHGHISIIELVKELRVSKRQFDRQFTKIVGVSPKRYSKILQLHYIINTMSQKKYSSIQDIANKSEFYDLSHFTHAFKELTGFSPVYFIKSNKHIALKYFRDLD